MEIEKSIKMEYIPCLSKAIQNKIKKNLKKLELSKEETENALNSKICDLEDTIKIKYI